MPRADFRNVALITYYVGTSVGSPATLEIADPRSGDSRTVELDSTPGIHRFRWDFGFDARAYTEAQRLRIAATFDRLLRESPVAQQRLRQAYERFLGAQTPAEERDAAQILMSPLVPSYLPPEYGMPVAGPGTYMLKMAVDGAVMTGTLQVRADPMLGQQGRGQ